MPDKEDPKDSYDVYTNGHEKDVFLKHPNGAEFIGQVWPGLVRSFNFIEPG